MNIRRGLGAELGRVAMSDTVPALFVKNGCPYCRAAREFLDARRVAYEPVEVRGQPENMQELERISGQMRTPTLRIGGDVLADFDVEQLEPFLKKHQLL
jgi:glutaredoxin